jgi:hypothetical protein
MGTYVLVHGAWHTGKELETVAAPIKDAGHTVHLRLSKGIGRGTRNLSDWKKLFSRSLTILTRTISGMSSL